MGGWIWWRRHLSVDPFLKARKTSSSVWCHEMVDADMVIVVVCRQQSQSLRISLFSSHKHSFGLIWLCYLLACSYVRALVLAVCILAMQKPCVLTEKNCYWKLFVFCLFLLAHSTMQYLCTIFGSIFSTITKCGTFTLQFLLFWDTCILSTGNRKRLLGENPRSAKRRIFGDISHTWHFHLLCLL